MKRITLLVVTLLMTTAFAKSGHIGSAPKACSLTTKQKVRKHIYPAISKRYQSKIKDSTRLYQFPATDLYAVVILSTMDAGCVLRNFSVNDLVYSDTANGLAQEILDDLMRK